MVERSGWLMLRQASSRSSVGTPLGGGVDWCMKERERRSHPPHDPSFVHVAENVPGKAGRAKECDRVRHDRDQDGAAKDVRLQHATPRPRKKGDPTCACGECPGEKQRVMKARIVERDRDGEPERREPERDPPLHGFSPGREG